MTLKEKIYNNSPVFIQNMMCTAYGYLENRKRFNDDFKTKLEFYKGSDKYSCNEIELFQKEKLSELLIKCKGIPLYSNIIEPFSIDIIEGNPYQVLKTLPVIDKSVVRDNFANIIDKSVESYKVNTSGTSGTALTLAKCKSDMAAQVACWFRHRSRFGINVGDESVNFTGKCVVPIKQKMPPYWRYNKAWNQYLVNMQHINEENINSIVVFLNSIQPKFYSGYPSIIADVARLALQNGLVLNEDSKPSIIFTGAENLLDWQLEYINSWVGSPVTDLYGLTEGNCNLSKCQHGYYHEDFELCISEIINVVPLKDGMLRGDLVSTGLELKAFPLLRYKTGDVAIQMPKDFVCKCGRSGKVYHSIEGRIDDYVLTPEGSRIMRFDYLFKGTNQIQFAQVIQKILGSITIKIKLRDEPVDIQDLEQSIMSKFKEIVSETMEVKFEYVEKIDKSNTGKFKAVINKLVND